MSSSAATVGRAPTRRSASSKKPENASPEANPAVFHVLPADVAFIAPHDEAWLYHTSHEEQQLLYRQAVQIMTGSGLQTGTDEALLVAQTGLVNLWFFLRFIASQAGPYDLLNPVLHKDMADFYQLCAQPGMKAFAALFRGGYKSSVFTHGGNTHDMLRDPNIEIVLASNIYDRSIEFLEYSQVTFKDNGLFRELYPDAAVKHNGRAPHWNKQEMIVGNKSRHMNRPNLRAVAVGGSIQGVHGDVFKIDDLIGEHQLNAQMVGGAEFEKAAKWGMTAVRNIPRSNRRSRVFVTGTRYGPGDSYTWIWDDIGSFYGCDTEEPYRIKANGEWTVYYRAARENVKDVGYVVTMPEKWSHEELDKIELEDPWTYYTQIQNRSTFSGLSEFSDYNLKKCTLDFEAGRAIVGHMLREGELVHKDLTDMDLLVSLDPAGMGRNERQSTSKWAVCVYARDWEGNRFVLEGQTKFGPPSDWIPILWSLFAKYHRYGLRGTFVEMIGPFAVLEDAIREEQKRRGSGIMLRPVRSQKGDKISRIRMALQPVLDGGRLFATEQIINELQSQVDSFPNGTWMDLLDAVATAEIASHPARDPEEEYEAAERKKISRTGVNRWTGY